jgi:hypothetical protein
MLKAHGFLAPNPGTLNGAIKRPQITGGEGYDIMAGGTQEFMFSLRPLSGLADIAARLPRTQIPRVSSTEYQGLRKPGDPATTDGASDTGSADNGGPSVRLTWNGAGLTACLDCIGGSIAAGAGSPLPYPNLPSSGVDGHVDPFQVSECQTPASLGIKMHVVGFMAKLLRGQAGNNTEYYTNAITQGREESLDVILDTNDAGCEPPGCVATYHPVAASSIFYTPDLGHLSNDVENFGGLRIEVHICATVTGASTYANTCN